MLSIKNLHASIGDKEILKGINLEVNLLKYVKVFGGANYRFAFGEEKTPGMSRAAATFGVKVGFFDKRIRSANAR